MNRQPSEQSRPVVGKCFTLTSLIHLHLHHHSSNVTFLLGEQLETLVYASVKTAERAARESRWGVRIWAEMIKSLLSDLHIEEVDVGTVPNILLYVDINIKHAKGC